MAEALSLKDKTIWVAGIQGMCGSAIMRRLESDGLNVIGTSRAECELTDYQAVQRFYEKAQPDVVFLAAAKVGGIFANQQYPVDYIYENLMIQNHVIHLAYF